MHLPLRGVSLVPSLPRPAEWGAALQQALDLPPVTCDPVVDAAGVPYACDLVAQDGFYLTVACVLLWAVARRALLPRLLSRK